MESFFFYIVYGNYARKRREERGERKGFAGLVIGKYYREAI